MILYDIRINPLVKATDEPLPTIGAFNIYKNMYIYFFS